MRRDFVDLRHSYGMHHGRRGLATETRRIRPQNAKRKGYRDTKGCNVCPSRLMKIPLA